MTKRGRRTVGRIAAIVRVGVIVGVAAAAVAYPLVAIGGLGVKTGADLINKLPREIKIPPLTQTSYVYAADGKTLLTTFYEEHRKYTPIEEMSPFILQAVVASEDGRFYEHRGVDVKGIVRAFVANREAGEVSQGASTLTMQYVRAALRDGAETPEQVRAATEQTTARKVREMRLAVELEKTLTKSQILERYLNVAYFGHRAYGIFAAAEVFFSKRPKDLTLTEAALLAGVVKAPSTYDPAGSDVTAANDRRNYVIDRMTELAYLSPEVAATAKAEPIQLRLTTPPNDCSSVPAALNDWGFFCDLLKTWWISQPGFGNSPAERFNKLRRGGYRIVLSLDPAIQKAAQRAVLAKEPVTSRFAHGTVAIEPGSGLVKAMAVNRIYSLDQSRNGPHSDPARRGKIPGNYPNTVNPLLGGGDLPGYQAGSTFKWFTLVAALDAGFKLSTAFHAPMRYTSIYRTGWNDRSSCGGRWCPVNASGGMTGRQDMRTGFGKSVNTYFVQLEQAVGAERAVRMAERLGLTWHTDVDRMMASPARANGWGAFTLGVADTTPLEMANAYATAAADGIYCQPLPVLSISNPDGSPATFTDERGKVVEIAKPRCHPAISAAAAQAAVDAARCVTGYGAASGSCGGWSTAPGVFGQVGRPVAGKTGTTDDTRSAWFVGMTPDLAAASFIADPDNPFHVVGDWQSWKPITSVVETLRNGLAGRPVRQFTPPPPQIR